MFIPPSCVRGIIEVPSSKSMIQRALAAALLAEGESVILKPTYSGDVLSLLSVLEILGAGVVRAEDKIIVGKREKPRSDHLDFGEGALAVRMLAPIVSLAPGTFVLAGKGTLEKRPMGGIEKAFESLGVVCKTNGGFLPIALTGPLRGGRACIDGSETSQFLTGLLFALPCAREDSRLDVDNLVSKPYIDMTLSILLHFGVQVHTNLSKTTFWIAGQQRFQPKVYEAEGDWSAASFFFVAGAIAGEIQLTHLSPFSLQADKAILEVLHLVGAKVERSVDGFRVKRENLRAFSFNALDCPDLFPALVALASCCEGVSKIGGLHRLKSKESDRALALSQEFSKMGISIAFSEDTMYVQGGKLHHAIVDSHHDHRIAMAAAIAGLVSDGGMTIDDPDCVNKSYPGFWEDLQKCKIAARP